MSEEVAAPRLTPWRFVVVFGVVSLLMDVVYEGARSITGPLLASFGASGLVVGLVTGAGEAAALGLRLVSGPLADRTHRFWAWTIGGYVLTAASVPVLGFAGVLWAASALVIAERVGKAVRSPAKDTMVSHATAVVGRGKGFAVHEAMDQVGALAGPLAVAGMLALTGDYGPSLAVLAVPGVAAVALLFWLRARVPRPEVYEPAAVAKERPTIAGSARLPRAFWTYATFTGATMLGFTTFGLVSFHLVTDGLVTAAVVPLLYAAVMAADAVSALVTGWAYDRMGPRVLASLPVLSAGAVALAFTSHVWVAVAGTLVWGAALGIQESTLRATVADLVPPARRATAYGVFAAVLGAAAAVGGGLTGALYDASPRALVVTVVGIEAAALLLLLALSRARAPGAQA
ncbi:MFS transporter [Nocardioides panacisoli]|uniref:MFS transporter n=1 Tax=Nocardioides panacisoli TaxID=627624 RepID=A0ABP7IUZ6_9ACTN